MALYPSPKGADFGQAGGLVGNLRLATGADPLPWARLLLKVATAPNTELRLVGQSDGRGDFRIPLRRLPPLGENVSSYAAVLSLEASAAARPDQPANPDQLTPMGLGQLTQDGFAAEIPVNVKPGEVLHLQSFDHDYLAVKPA